MRVSPALLALMAGAALLSACNKPSSPSSAQPAADQAANPTEPASAPAAPTPDQIKALIATLPAPYNTGDYENGKTQFAQCAACHTTTQGAPNMTGPNLYGIFGRKSGTAANFSYSDGVAALNQTWDAPKIDTWITNPKAVVADTHMTFVGMKDPKNRIDTIAYLKVATSPAS
jgi:cytochrome c